MDTIALTDDMYRMTQDKLKGFIVRIRIKRKKRPASLFYDQRVCDHIVEALFFG